ncbi:DUF1015 domain-containing protein [Robiginitalea sp. SC105]|uniref:DUF1015 domain-containing protein n=1 Tax=Robiginitalea sp. SC105 TaxID=2762332 RepID=UPI00163A6A67|nr:DUF1015 domain-containing protein [Robiginitalea sp. SC105]MBC2840753.1 DUF1015 domain-containing protein [Robiginitalea sp. SC105]
MAEILPFAAIRPAVDKAPFVVSRSWDDYLPRDRNAEMRANPFSFLHIIDPGFKFNTALSGVKRHKLVRNRYLEFLEEGILVKEDRPSFYIYQSSRPGFTCRGIFCATSTNSYRQGLIRPHEDTIRRREELFADYLEQVRFNAEPVLLTYPDHPGVAGSISAALDNPPEYHFTTPDRVEHKLWIVSETKTVAAIRDAFREIPALYIADGHHRSASSDLLARRLQEANPSHSGKEPYNYFMSYLIPESQVRIRSFHRLLRELGGMDPASILMQLDAHFRIKPLGAKPFEPAEKHTFSMYMDGAYYELRLRKESQGGDSFRNRLDVHILNDRVLKPVFGITDPRRDQRLAYRYWENPAHELKAEVDSGRFAAGFGMVPATMEEIRQVADSGETMPPKSTFLEPKLRSGLTIYDI